MKLNSAEKALMNNPGRAVLERHHEARVLERLGGRPPTATAVAEPDAGFGDRKLRTLSSREGRAGRWRTARSGVAGQRAVLRRATASMVTTTSSTSGVTTYFAAAL